jgi:hypothetical protein
MKNIRSRKAGMISVVVFSAFVLFGCNSDDNIESVSYQMSVTNLTNNQPLSPPAFVLHTKGYNAWNSGDTASEGVEQLAEGGDPSPFLEEALESLQVLMTAEGSSVIGPGNTASVSIELARNSDMRISFAAMLVNTNDAFTGITDAYIGSLASQESVTLIAVAYDAGTEANSETATYIPGPAAGGEGYNPQLNDRGFIVVHPGVITADDGLAASALDESHRWRNPVARLTVTRTK